ncbi:MAG TPA: hypothetical protein VLE53_07300 [Gemmatimonadaceae bacterium]|nr:hypothetical protein [Gemmatimonadaceae bacterium]
MLRRWGSSLRQLAWLLPIFLVAALARPDATASEELDTQAQSRLTRGRMLVISSGCGDCHGGFDNPAAPGWLQGMRDTVLQQFIIPTPMGTFKTRPRNLTPDNTTGLGRFSERQIFNALRFGLRPGETPDVEITSTTPGQGNFPANPKFLAPPMPWPAFRHKPDQDLRDIAFYLKNGLKPVSNQVPDSEGPPDFWVGLYGQFIGPATPPAFPTTNEKPPQ